MKVKNINFCNIVTLGVDLKKLKYKTSKKKLYFIILKHLEEII